MNEMISVQGFGVSYDKESDVLYVTRRPDVPARSREEGQGLVWRYDIVTGDLIGLTIIDFAGYWGSRRGQLAEKIAARFGVSRRDAFAIVDNVEASAQSH